MPGEKVHHCKNNQGEKCKCVSTFSISLFRCNLQKIVICKAIMLMEDIQHFSDNRTITAIILTQSNGWKRPWKKYKWKVWTEFESHLNYWKFIFILCLRTIFLAEENPSVKREDIYEYLGFSYYSEGDYKQVTESYELIWILKVKFCLQKYKNWLTVWRFF